MRMPCKCCGCEIATIPDAYDSEDVLLLDEVEGWYAVRNRLSPSGNYTIRLVFKFRRVVPGSYRVEFSLIKNDDSVFASWHHAGTFGFQTQPYLVNGNPVSHIHDREWSINWLDETITRQDTVNDAFYAGGITPIETAGAEFNGDRTLFDDRLTVRPAAGLFRGRTNCTLPLDATELADAGSLRLRFRIVDGWDINEDDFTLAITAEKTLVEAIEDGETCTGQNEKNADCIHPTHCPVTYPNYGTPQLNVDDISGMRLRSFTPTADPIFEGCRTRIYVPPTTTTEANRQFSLAYSKDVTAIDTPFYRLPYPDGLEGEALETYVLDLANWEPQDQPPIYDIGDLDCTVTTNVLATDDPCVWKVRAECRTGVFPGAYPLNNQLFFNNQVLEYEDYKGQAFSSSSTIAFNYPENIDRNQAVLNFLNWTPGGLVPSFRVDFVEKVFVFEKEVPRWDGPPPTITFEADDLVEQNNVFARTTYSKEQNSLEMIERDGIFPSFFVRETSTTAETLQHMNAEDVTLTIDADVLTDLPHP